MEEVMMPSARRRTVTTRSKRLVDQGLGTGHRKILDNTGFCLEVDIVVVKGLVSREIPVGGKLQLQVRFWSLELVNSPLRLPWARQVRGKRRKWKRPTQFRHRHNYMDNINNSRLSHEDTRAHTHRVGWANKLIWKLRSLLETVRAAWTAAIRWAFVSRMLCAYVPGVHETGERGKHIIILQ